MKNNRRLKKILLIILVLLTNFINSSLYYNVCAGNESSDETQEILKSQSDSIGISSFIEEANKYKSEDFDIDINELVSSAIKGEIDNKTLWRKISSTFFKHIGETIKTMRKYNDNNHNI